MARVNVFDLIKSISQESVSHPEVKDVNVAEKPPTNVKDDTPQEGTDTGIKAAVTNTATTQPGPATGGGDGTAEFTAADKAAVKVNVKDLNIEKDQNGGRHVDTLPSQVKAKDNLSSSDVRTSVEEHESNDEISTLKTIETGGVDAIEPADELVMDLDTALDSTPAAGIMAQSELDEATMGKILKDVGELEKAKASVEGYIGILKRMEKRGLEMSNELRTSMAIGLESISEELFRSEVITLEEYRVSNEAVQGIGKDPLEGDIVDDDDTEFDGARDKTSKGLMGKLKRIWEALKRAFHRSVNALMDLWQSFTADTTKISEHLKGLRNRVRKLEGGKEIKMKNSQRLMIGDEFVGHSSDALKRVTRTSKELLLDFPTKLVAVMEKIKSQSGIFAAGTGIGEMLEAFEDIFRDSFRSFKQLPKSDKMLIPSGFLDAQSISWSEALPGNRAVYVGVNRAPEAAGGAILDASKFSKSLIITFSQIPNTDAQGAETEVVTPSAGEATNVIRALEELISQINGRREGMAAIKKIAADANSSAWSGIFSGGGEASLYGLVLAQGLASATTSAEHSYIGYLISMIKAYVGYLEGSIKSEDGLDDDSKNV